MLTNYEMQNLQKFNTVPQLSFYCINDFFAENPY